MPTVTSLCTKSVIEESLTTSYEWIMELAHDLADAPMTSPTPNQGNHPVWIMGHLANSTWGLVSMITGETNPCEHWDKLFQGGTNPSNDPSIYPSYSNILDEFSKAHRHMLDVLNGLSDDDLNSPVPNVSDEFKEFPNFRCNGSLLLFIGMHNMSHRGQLADARRALGRKPFA